MTVLVLILVAIAVAAVFLAIIIVALIAYRRSILRALPAAPPPPPDVDCALPGGTLPTANDADVTLTGNETETDIRGNTITLPINTGFNFPPAGLTLVAYGDLTIDGSIPIVVGSGDSITLVSLTGTVTIGAAAVVGLRAQGAFSGLVPVTNSGLYSLALGAPGATGGYIKIVAPVVVIDGTIGAEPGSGGSAALATGVGSGPIGGTAVAVGGRGGFGGTVLICAEEAINVNSLATIRGGNGGGGGNATATSANGSRALATGAAGNDGGDVIFTGTGAGPCPVTVQVLSGVGPPVKGGDGGNGGLSTATGGPGTTSSLRSLVSGQGGKATAIGGPGGNGGTVRFVNCVVSPGASITAGSGGNGNAATATAGTGTAAVAFTGYAGGDADAEGGDGGRIGARPSYPLIGGGTATVALPRVPGGSGGNATATGGTGGIGGGSPVFAGGGDSGGANAVGGSNPNTGATATPATSAPVAGTAGAAGAGGASVPATSRGAP